MARRHESLRTLRVPYGDSQPVGHAQRARSATRSSIHGEHAASDARCRFGASEAWPTVDASLRTLRVPYGGRFSCVERTRTGYYSKSIWRKCSGCFRPQSIE
jgi:hypothetical protein